MTRFLFQVPESSLLHPSVCTAAIGVYPASSRILILLVGGHGVGKGAVGDYMERVHGQYYSLLLI